MYAWGGQKLSTPRLNDVQLPRQGRSERCRPSVSTHECGARGTDSTPGLAGDSSCAATTGAPSRSTSAIATIERMFLRMISSGPLAQLSVFSPTWWNQKSRSILVKKRVAGDRYRLSTHRNELIADT